MAYLEKQRKLSSKLSFSWLDWLQKTLIHHFINVSLGDFLIFIVPYSTRFQPSKNVANEIKNLSLNGNFHKQIHLPSVGFIHECTNCDSFLSLYEWINNSYCSTLMKFSWKWMPKELQIIRIKLNLFLNSTPTSLSTSVFEYFLYLSVMVVAMKQMKLHFVISTTKLGQRCLLEEVAPTTTIIVVF